MRAEPGNPGVSLLRGDQGDYVKGSFGALTQVFSTQPFPLAIAPSDVAEKLLPTPLCDVVAAALSVAAKGSDALSGYTCSGGRIFSTWPAASRAWYSFQLIGSLPVSTS